MPDGARLTFGSHFPLRRLFFALQAVLHSADGRRGLSFALSLRGLRIGH
jgi:hypothetical protein